MKKLTYKARKETDTAPLKIQGRVVMEHDITTLKKGNYRITIEAWRNKASHSQFKWLFGGIYPQTLILLNDIGYEFTNVDQVDIFWKELYANKELLIRETGEIRLVPLSKSEFLTIDHMAFVSNIRNHCINYLGSDIEDPDPDWKQRKLEIQAAIEKEAQNKINANEL
jgi:hypothetical protein